jgi:hypothetical protein
MAARRRYAPALLVTSFLVAQLAVAGSQDPPPQASSSSTTTQNRPSGQQAPEAGSRPHHHRPLKQIDNVEPLEYNIELTISGQPEATATAGELSSRIEGRTEIYVKFLAECKRAPAAGQQQHHQKRWQRVAGVVACFAKKASDGSQKHNTTAGQTIALNVGRAIRIADEEAAVRVELGPSLDAIKRGQHESLAIARRVYDQDQQLLGLELARPLPAGSFGRITIKFSTEREHEMATRYARRSSSPQPSSSYWGWWSSSSQSSSSSPWPWPSLLLNVYHATQQGPAGMAFPCFNDPKYRPRITLSVTADERLQAYSNMPASDRSKVAQSLARTTFAQTPPMPVHGLVLSLGRYDQPTQLVAAGDGDDDNGLPLELIRVVTANGQPATGRFALELARQALDWMTRKTGRALPVRQFTMIATADLRRPWQAAANLTDSLGCVLVNADLLLVHEQHSSPETKILAALHVAQAVSRQWFGQVLSASSWQDVWLAHGLAAYVAVDMLRELRPELGVQHYARSHLLVRAMQARALAAAGSGSRPDPALNYIKSAALVSLLRSLVGGKSFYMSVGQLFTDTSDDLIDRWRLAAALVHATERQFSTELIVKLIDDWLCYVSFPVLSVQIDHVGTKRSVQIFQNPVHRLTRIDSVGEWPNPHGLMVPVTMAFSSMDGSRRELTRLELAFKERPVKAGPRWNEQHVTVPEWFDLRDSGSGHWLRIRADRDTLLPFYAIRYMATPNLMARLRAALVNGRMDPDDRASLLLDAAALVRVSPKYAEALRLDDLFEWLQLAAAAAGQEIDYAVVNAELVAWDSYAAAFADENTNIEHTRWPAILLRPAAACKQLFGEHGLRQPASVFEEFVTQNALVHLIERDHKPTIEAALQAFGRRQPMAAGFLRAPIYAAVSKTGTRQQKLALAKRLQSAPADWPEEIDRLRAVLERAPEPELREQVAAWCATRACAPLHAGSQDSSEINERRPVSGAKR